MQQDDDYFFLNKRKQNFEQELCLEQYRYQKTGQRTIKLDGGLAESVNEYSRALAKSADSLRSASALRKATSSIVSGGNLLKGSSSRFNEDLRSHASQPDDAKQSVASQ